MNRLSRKRLIDKLVAAYVDWREACVRVNDAYRFWASEPGPSDGVAFGLYVAALDAEQQAAAVYAGVIEGLFPRREGARQDRGVAHRDRERGLTSEAHDRQR
jgi:hypothetical protein